MPARFDAVVFDWDGTIFDSTALITRSIQGAARDLGLAVPDDATASHVIGLGLRDALTLAVPGLTADRINDFSARYRHHYLAREPEIILFGGIRALLDELAADTLLAVATGKSDAGLQRVLAATGLRGHFRATRCADQTEPKPHPAMLLELSEELAVAPDRMLMIGDTTHDLQMARAAGAWAIGVTYGAHERAALAALAPLALVDSVGELHAWLARRR